MAIAVDTYGVGQAVAMDHEIVHYRKWQIMPKDVFWQALSAKTNAGLPCVGKTRVLVLCKCFDSVHDCV